MTPSRSAGSAEPFPVSREPFTANLDALAEIAGTVTVFGREVAVRQFDGESYRALELQREQGDASVVPSYAIAARLCPDLTADEVQRLNARQVGAILAIGARVIHAVEAALPNGASPAMPPVALG